MPFIFFILAFAFLSGPSPAFSSERSPEQPLCKVGEVLPEGWYVFAQDDSDHWKDLQCPRPATLDDAHFNVWRTAPAVDPMIFSCRDTPLPKGYSLSEKLFKPECPSAGINLLGEPVANTYKLLRQTPVAVSEAPMSNGSEARPDANADGPAASSRKADAARGALEHATAGNQYFTARRYAEAEAEFREAGKLEPLSADWPALVALALLLQNKYEEAQTEAQVAVRLDPKNAMVHSALAGAFGGLAQWKEAEVEARVSLRLDPTGSRGIPGLPQYLLGISLWHLGKKDQGEDTLRDIVAKQERYRGKFAELLFEDGKLDEAEAQYREALKINPQDQFLAKGLRDVLHAKEGNQ